MNSWTRKLRMGMVGGGQGAFIGSVHRIAAALDGQAELVAGVFSRDWANTQATGAQLYLDPTRLYKTYEEMATAEARLPADRRIDFVVIVTPNNAHYGPAKAFLGKGFHVVCDKPLAFTVAEAEDLVQLVEHSGRISEKFQTNALHTHATAWNRIGGTKTTNAPGSRNGAPEPGRTRA